jgi:hypothetical protein
MTGEALTTVTTEVEVITLDSHASPLYRVATVCTPTASVVGKEMVAAPPTSRTGAVFVRPSIVAVTVPVGVYPGAVAVTLIDAA